MAEAQETTPRIGRFRGVDRTFAAIMAGVFLFNFGLASAIASRAKTWTDDWALLEELTTGRTATRLVLPLPKPTKKPTPKAEGQGAIKTASTGPSKSQRGQGGPQKTKASLDHLVKTVGVMALLGSKGLGNGTDLVDQLVDGREATTLEKAMRDARSQGVDMRLDGGGDRRGPQSGDVKSIGDLATQGGADHDSRHIADRGPARPKPRVTFEEEDDPPPTTPGCERTAIAKVVKRGLSALQACYELETKKIPTLAGKVVVRFTLSEAGRVTEVEFDEDTVGSPGLRRCIERTFRYWAFPAAPTECVLSHPIVFAPVP